MEITPEAQPIPPKSPRTRRIQRFPSLAKLLQIQQVMENDALNGESQKERSASARVWKELEQLRMVKQGWDKVAGEGWDAD